MTKGDVDYLEYIRTRTTKPPVALHKYASAEIANLILSSGKIRFQSPLKYNDPFDSQWDPSWTLRTPEALEFQKQVLTGAINDLPSWPAGANPEFKDALLSERSRIDKLPPQSRSEAIREFVEDVTGPDEQEAERLAQMLDFRRRLRVLCLSANPEMVTMWSYYADQHRGVVLTFDTAVLENGFKRPFEQVEYKDVPPKILDMETWYRASTFGLPQPEFPEDPKVWIRTKSPEWSYEKEWRFAFIASKGTRGDYQDVDIPRRSLVEITLGCRTDQELGRNLIALAQPLNEHVKLSQLYKPVGSFSLAKKVLSLSDFL